MTEHRESFYRLYRRLAALAPAPPAARHLRRARARGLHRPMSCAAPSMLRAFNPLRLRLMTAGLAGPSQVGFGLIGAPPWFGPTTRRASILRCQESVHRRKARLPTADRFRHFTDFSWRAASGCDEVPHPYRCEGAAGGHFSAAEAGRFPRPATITVVLERLRRL